MLHVREASLPVSVVKGMAAWCGAKQRNGMAVSETIDSPAIFRSTTVNKASAKSGRTGRTA
jgi:hypothetical protein